MAKTVQIIRNLHTKEQDLLLDGYRLVQHDARAGADRAGAAREVSQ